MSGELETPNPLEKLRPIVSAQLQAGAQWLRERELSHQQAFVLNFLKHNAGSIQREIASASGTSAANVSGVVRGLEARGLVERSSDDERSKRVSATRRGLALISGHEEAMAASDERIVAALSSTQRQLLSALLDTIIRALPDQL